MANNDWDRDREQDRERERDRDRSYDQRERREYRARQEGERRPPDIGRSNEYGSHAGWGGQGFSQGSFGSFGGQGERLYTQQGGQGWGAETGYSGREAGGGMSTYHGPGSIYDRDRWRGTERGGNPENYGPGNEGWRPQDRDRSDDRGDRDRRDWDRYDQSRNQNYSGREGGWGGYGSYDRERRPDYDQNRFQGERRTSSQGWSGSQGWVGAQQGWAPGSMNQSTDQNRGQHFGRGPKGWKRSDDRIREDVSERLADHPDVDASDIEVQVNAGEVILKGSVDDRNAKRLAEDIAENVSGVRDVQNQIRVNRGFWGSIKDTLTGNNEADTDRDRSGQPQTTTGDIVSANTSPTHTITPGPEQTVPSRNKQTEPVGSRK